MSTICVLQRNWKRRITIVIWTHNPHPAQLLVERSFHRHVRAHTAPTRTPGVVPSNTPRRISLGLVDRTLTSSTQMTLSLSLLYNQSFLRLVAAAAAAIFCWAQCLNCVRVRRSSADGVSRCRRRQTALRRQRLVGLHHGRRPAAHRGFSAPRCSCRLPTRGCADRRSAGWRDGRSTVPPSQIC